MSELIAELKIKRSATKDLKFAQEHGVKLVSVVEIVDDDQRVIATADLAGSWQRLIDDCEQSLRTVDQMLAERDRLALMEAQVDGMTERVERLREAVKE